MVKIKIKKKSHCASQMLLGTPKRKIGKPFVKWIGGKMSVIDHLIGAMPKEFGAYYEPFLGGGALFFAQGFKSKRSFLSDVNSELVNAYRTVADLPEQLISRLRKHQHLNSHDYYYEVRASHPKSEVARAARLLYLLKTCFNGLYRENSKGTFNAAYGYYKKPDVVQEENIRACADALSRASVSEKPFWELRPRAGDFVYFDPPYHGAYRRYNAKQFSEDDQIRLRDMALRLAQRGVFVMISSSSTDFINGIYADPVFRKRIVLARRTVSRTSNRRGKEGELLITTYKEEA